MVSDPEHIAISKSNGVKIDWNDRHRSEETAAYLIVRDECPAQLHGRARNGAAEDELLGAAARAAKFQMLSPP